MAKLEIKALASAVDDIAPDGSLVRKLLALGGGSMAHYTLKQDQVSRAVVHQHLEEIWFVIGGRGEIARKAFDATDWQIDTLDANVCIALPRGTCFQFRAGPDGPLTVIGVTMPPWPGDAAAMRVEGCWR